MAEPRTEPAIQPSAQQAQLLALIEDQRERIATMSIDPAIKDALAAELSSIEAMIASGRITSSAALQNILAAFQQYVVSPAATRSSAEQAAMLAQAFDAEDWAEISERERRQINQLIASSNLSTPRERLDYSRAFIQLGNPDLDSEVVEARATVLADRLENDPLGRSVTRMIRDNASNPQSVSVHDENSILRRGLVDLINNNSLSSAEKASLRIALENQFYTHPQGRELLRDYLDHANQQSLRAFINRVDEYQSDLVNTTLERARHVSDDPTTRPINRALAEGVQGIDLERLSREIMLDPERRTAAASVYARLRNPRDGMTIEQLNAMPQHIRADVYAYMVYEDVDIHALLNTQVSIRARSLSVAQRTDLVMRLDNPNPAVSRQAMIEFMGGNDLFAGLNSQDQERIASRIEAAIRVTGSEGGYASVIINDRLVRMGLPDGIHTQNKLATARALMELGAEAMATGDSGQAVFWATQVESALRRNGWEAGHARLVGDGLRAGGVLGAGTTELLTGTVSAVGQATGVNRALQGLDYDNQARRLLENGAANQWLRNNIVNNGNSPVAGTAGGALHRNQIILEEVQETLRRAGMSTDLSRLDTNGNGLTAAELNAGLTRAVTTILLRDGREELEARARELNASGVSFNSSQDTNNDGRISAEELARVLALRGVDSVQDIDTLAETRQALGMPARPPAVATTHR